MRAAGQQAAVALLLVAAVSRTRAEAIDDILGSLTAAVSFLEREREQVNLDGLVGFVSLQAVLKVAVQNWPHSDPVSWAQRASTAALIRRLDQSVIEATAAVKRSDLQYFREFEPLLSWRFWAIPHEWTSTDASLVYPITNESDCFDEPSGDKCMSLLLGTWKVNGTPCIATKSCLDIMTTFGCQDYSLSHQHFYFMIGKMKGCNNLLKGYARASQANMTVRGYESIFCSNMMKINQDIFRNSLKEKMIDIFMENIFFCGLDGFSDFYKPDWLQWIIRRQDKDLGCFVGDDVVSADKLLEQPHPPHSRVKRREKVLSDGCSSHTTSIAVGALGGYLEFYLTEQDTTKRPLS